MQEVTGDAVEIAFVDSGYTGAQVAQDAAAHHRQLEVVKLPEAKKGLVLLPKRWVVERTVSWLGQSRRLSQDYERFCATSEAIIYAIMSRLMVRRLAVA